MRHCSYCGRSRGLSSLNRLKVGAGPDLYFCKDPCSKEVARSLSR